MERLLLPTLLRPAWLAFALCLLLGGLGTFAQAALSAALLPGAALLGRMLLGALASALAIAVPIGVLSGALFGGRALREEGAWLAMQTLGVSGRRLLPGCLLYLGFGVGAAAAVSHGVEPWGRSLLRDARAEATASVVPIPGRTLSFGEWALAVEGERLHFASEKVVGTAAYWKLSPAMGGVAATLGPGEIRTRDGVTQVSFQHLSMPLPLPGRGTRVEIAERPTSTLHGRSLDAYERWILYKRSLLPLVLLPLGLGALPLGLGRRSAPGAFAALVVGLWGGVRTLDGLAGSLGAGAAAGILGLLAAGFLGGTLSRWREK